MQCGVTLCISGDSSRHYTCTRINLDRSRNGKSFAIESDSQTAIKAISSLDIRSRRVWECQKRVNLQAVRWLSTGCLGISVWGERKYRWTCKKGDTGSSCGTRTFCDLGDALFKEELDRGMASKRNIIWRNPEDLKQAEKIWEAGISEGRKCSQVSVKLN